MVKKTKYTATIGATTFTRQTARTYTHCVVTPRSLAKDRKDVERRTRANWKVNLPYRQRCAEGRPVPGCTYTVTPFERAESQRLLELGEEGLVAELLAKFDADNAGRPDSYWQVEGWCGRPDLAASLAHAAGAGAEILPAVAA